LPNQLPAPKVDTSMLDTVAQDRGARLFDITKEQYPYLKDKDVGYKYSPDPKSPYKLEFYQQDDIPDWAKGKSTAIEVFHPQTTPQDLYGDYISHYAVNTDPKLQQMYQQFQKGITPQGKKFIAELVDEAKRGGEKNTETPEYMQRVVIPQYLRGYLVNQFEPKDFSQAYSPQQIQLLKQMKQYLGIK